LYRRLGGPQGRSGQVRKISPPLGFDPRTRLILEGIKINFMEGIKINYLREVDALAWIGLIWLGTGTGGGLL